MKRLVVPYCQCLWEGTVPLSGTDFLFLRRRGIQSPFRRPMTRHRIEKASSRCFTCKFQDGHSSRSSERQRGLNPLEQCVAQRTIRASPPPHSAEPHPRGLPVDPSCEHRWSFSCCVQSPLRTYCRLYPGRTELTDSLVFSPQRRHSP